jgi:hypothetical protein
MTSGRSTSTMNITKKSDLAEIVREESLASWSLFFLILVPSGLFTFLITQLGEGRREKVELMLPIGILVASLSLSAIFGLKSSERFGTQVWLRAGRSVALVTVSAAVLHRPPAVLDYLWYGFGRRVLGLSIVVFAIWWLLSSSQFLKAGRRPYLVVAVLVGLSLYLPSFIQPPWGVINLGDASHQVMEEVSGPLVGHFPGINFVSTYTTLLGLPLLLLRPLPLGHIAEMSVVLLWVNALVLAVPVLLVVVGLKSRTFGHWLTGAVFVIPPLMVSGKWGAAASNVESLSMIPGRTLLPVALGLLVMTQLSDERTRGVRVVGFAGVVVAFNNVEFGLPATFAAFVCIATAMLISEERIRLFRSCLSGVIAAMGLLVIGSLVVDGRFDFWFRVGSYAGKPYSPAEVFPVWSTHNLLLGLFGTSIIVGFLTIRSLSRPSFCAIFFGVWGLSSFPYCSYRCLEGMYMATQVYLIPTIGATLGMVGCLRSRITMSSWDGRVRCPLFVMAIGSLALGCVVQAPNPIDEWKRVIGAADAMPWASDERRGIPSEWSSTKIDWLDVPRIVNARSQIRDLSVGYFGYMGNSVQLATGINNLTRINSAEVLQIKGTKKLEELACREVDDMKPHFIILVGMELPCTGYQETTQFQVDDGIRILVRTNDL